MAKKFYIIDGHSLLYRLFYAMPDLTAKGKPVGALLGFVKIILKLLREEKPDFFAIAFDTPAPTFRHEAFLEYKAHREKTPDELILQFNDVKEFLSVMGVPTFSIDGYEADDILGTMAAGMAQKGHKSTIITGDRDALQLVGPDVTVFYTRKGISDIITYDLKKIEEDYQLKPEQLIDVKALMGDTSDNIPGVPGIGEKTAMKLIKEYGNLENVLANLANLATRARNCLTGNQDLAYLSRDLAKISLEAPISIDEQELSWQEPNWEKVAELFKQWEFNSLLPSLPLANQKEEKAIDIILINNQKSWEEFKKDYQPLTFFPLAVNLEGNRPRELALNSIGLLGKAGIYIIEIGELSAEEVLNHLKTYLEDPALAKIGHNIKSFLEVCLEYGIEIKGLDFDTYLAAYIAVPSASSPNFSQLLERYEEKNMPEGDTKQALAMEIKYLPNIVEKMKDSLKEIAAEDILQDIELPLVPILAKMEFNGVKINEDYLHELTKELEDKLAGISHNIYAFTTKPFNINSPKQLGEILFEELKLPVIKRTKTGYSTNAEVLEKLRDFHPIIKEITEYRQLAKIKSTYSEALPPLVNKRTGRLHTTFNQTVTATGRLSSTEPNLQNIPIRTTEGQKIRKAFIAREGYQLLSADYSQIELRVLAHISNDKGLLEAFLAGEDIHAKTASEVFAIERQEVTNELRQRAKAINFGIVYGMSAFGLAQELNISQETAKSYIERYFSRYPLIKKYIDTSIEKARKDGYVATIFNRRRYLPDINNRIPFRRGFAERMAINTPIQGTAADIMKLAMIKVNEILKDKPEIAMLLQVHDELILEVPTPLLKETAQAVKEKMEKALELSVPLLVDVKAGKDWLSMEHF